MVVVQAVYEGGLRCTTRHGPSGQRFTTDAPRDNQGRGEAFSPTDLVAAALGTCMLTTMGIVARDRGWDLTGATATVTKRMAPEAPRRIGRLEVRLALPDRGLPPEARELLVRRAESCPVALSLDPRIEVPLEVLWTE